MFQSSIKKTPNKQNPQPVKWESFERKSDRLRKKTNKKQNKTTAP